MVQANLHFEGYVGGVEGYLNDKYEVRSDLCIENPSLHSDRFIFPFPTPATTAPSPVLLKFHVSFFTTGWICNLDQFSNYLDIIQTCKLYI